MTWRNAVPITVAAHEVYSHLLDGSFYDDYDEACRLTGLLADIVEYVAETDLFLAAELSESLVEPPTVARLTEALESILDLGRQNEHAYLFNVEFHACVEVARMVLHQP
jgi:hypothetical protein